MVRRVCVVAPASVTSWLCESSSAGRFLNLPTNIRSPLWVENPAKRLDVRGGGSAVSQPGKSS